MLSLSGSITLGPKGVARRLESMFWSVARPAGSRQTVDPGKFGSAAGPGSSLGFDSRHRVGCSLGWRLELGGDSSIAAFAQRAG